eukprot:jgi/Galph1/713/GphlegSOOS_G5540.1
MSLWNAPATKARYKVTGASFIVSCRFSFATQVTSTSGNDTSRLELDARNKIRSILTSLTSRRIKSKEGVTAILSDALWKLPRSARFQLFQETVNELHRNNLIFTLIYFYDRFLYQFSVEHELRQFLDSTTLATLLSAFSKSNCIEKGLLLIGLPSQTETRSLNIFQNDGTFLKNSALVEMYTEKLQKLVVSKKLDVSIVNELIKGVASQKSSYEAFLIMQAMLEVQKATSKMEIAPNGDTYHLVLAASSAEGLEKATLTLMQEALEKFPNDKRNLYSTVVGGFIRAKLPWEALAVFRQAESESIQVELNFYADLLQLFAQMNEIHAVEHIWTALQQTSEAENYSKTLTIGASESVLMCAVRWGNRSLAEQVFSALVEAHKHQTSFVLSAQSFYCLIEAKASEGDIPGAFDALRSMCEVGYQPRLANFTKFTRICGRNSRTLDFAYHHIRNLSQENTIYIEHVNILLASCGILGDLNRALSAYREFVDTIGLVPNQDTFHALFRGCITTCRDDVFRIVEEERQKYELEMNSDTCLLLVKVYVRCNELHEAIQTIQEALNRQLVLPLEAYQLVGRKAILQGDALCFETMVHLMKQHNVRVYNEFVRDIRTPFGIPEIREEMKPDDARVKPVSLFGSEKNQSAETSREGEASENDTNLQDEEQDEDHLDEFYLKDDQDKSTL